MFDPSVNVRVRIAASVLTLTPEEAEKVQELAETIIQTKWQKAKPLKQNAWYTTVQGNPCHLQLMLHPGGSKQIRGEIEWTQYGSISRGVRQYQKRIKKIKVPVKGPDGKAILDDEGKPRYRYTKKTVKQILPTTKKETVQGGPEEWKGVLSLWFPLRLDESQRARLEDVIAHELIHPKDYVFQNREQSEKIKRDTPYSPDFSSSDPGEVYKHDTHPIEYNPLVGQTVMEFYRRKKKGETKDQLLEAVRRWEPTSTLEKHLAEDPADWKEYKQRLFKIVESLFATTGTSVLSPQEKLLLLRKIRQRVQAKEQIKEPQWRAWAQRLGIPPSALKSRLRLVSPVPAKSEPTKKRRNIQEPSSLEELEEIPAPEEILDVDEEPIPSIDPDHIFSPLSQQNQPRKAPRIKTIESLGVPQSLAKKVRKAPKFRT